MKNLKTRQQVCSLPLISMEKLKAGIFNDPQIRELMKVPMFDKALIEAELSAWQSLKSLLSKFTGKLQRTENEKMDW